ncbi:MAG TPA: 4Fe-4S dicluster domain-containing protein [Symbiobacteriaceae bacterium]|jgi:ferredoxin
MNLEKAAELLTNLKPVRVESALCVQARSARAGCRACMDVCPAGSLTMGRGPQLGEGCIACGLCVSACPTGVFRLEEPSDAAVLGAARKVAGDPVIIACHMAAGALAQQAPERLLAVPCIGYVTLELLAGVLATGHRRVLLWRPAGCDGCARKAGAAMADGAARALNELLPGSVTLGAPAPLPAPEGVLAAGSGIDATMAAQDRRAFLGEAVRGAGGLMQLLLADWVKKPAPPPAFLVDKVGVAHRREVFAEALATLPVALEASLHLRAPAMSAQCTLCPVCSRLCPSGALRLDGAGEERILWWQASRCGDCGLCRDVCPLKAVSDGEVVTVGRVRAAAPERLVAGVAATCACGREYWRVAGGPERCLACRMRSQP